jgi:CRISPR-associated exonuclease Cas4
MEPRTVRGLTIRSLKLGVFGKADAVEFHGADANIRPYPVEYKRGRPKTHRADEVQLCAQAICLEEMFSQSVPAGALFYGSTRRRAVVAFDDTLRTLTARVAAEVRALLAAERTPPPVQMPACVRCSLVPTCWPGRLQRPPDITRWLKNQVAQ